MKQFLDQVYQYESCVNEFLLSPILGLVVESGADIKIQNAYSVGGVLHFGFEYRNGDAQGKYSTLPASECKVFSHEMPRVERLLASCIKSGRIEVAS